MSRDLYVSALDPEQLRALQGSGNQALLASLLDDNRDRVSDHDEYFRTFPGVARYVPLAEALGQIVYGRVNRDLTPIFQFEHAAALLADSLGERLPANLFAECTPAFLDEVDVVIRRRLITAGQSDTAWPALAEILKRGPCLDIPLDPQWPLGSGYLKADEVCTAAKAAGVCALEDLDDALNDLQWPEEALDAANQYRSWLCRAAAKRVGLYFHS